MLGNTGFCFLGGEREISLGLLFSIDLEKWRKAAGKKLSRNLSRANTRVAARFPSEDGSLIYRGERMSNSSRRTGSFNDFCRWYWYLQLLRNCCVAYAQVIFSTVARQKRVFLRFFHGQFSVSSIGWWFLNLGKGKIGNRSRIDLLRNRFYGESFGIYYYKRWETVGVPVTLTREKYSNVRSILRRIYIPQKSWTRVAFYNPIQVFFFFLPLIRRSLRSLNIFSNDEHIDF